MKISAKNILLIALSFVVLAAGVALVQQLGESGQLDRWKLIPHPEKLTELYFTSHTKLPAQYRPGQKQEVVFTIHNAEYATERYRYEVLQLDPTGPSQQVMTAGSVELADKTSKDILVTFIPADLGPKSQFVIKLVSHNQSISYLATKAEN